MKRAATAIFIYLSMIYLSAFSVQAATHNDDTYNLTNENTQTTEQNNDTSILVKENQNASYIENGFIESNGLKFYYVNGKPLINQFKEIAGKTYYFGSDGRMFTYTNNINGNIYYFNANGQMQKGFRFINNEVQYYDTESGARRYGMIHHNNKLYYLQGTSMIKNDFVKEGKYYYYFNHEGEAVKGWQTIDNKRRYFSSQYNMFRNGFYVLGNDTYYFGDDGQMYTYTNNIGGKQYFFGSNGKMFKGLRIVNNQAQFYNRENGERTYGLVHDEGNMYYLNSEGLIKNKLIKEGKYYYYFNEYGKAHKGWLKLDNKIRYFSSQCNMFRNGFYQLQGETYYFGDDGNMYTYLNNINGDIYFFNVSGVMQIGKLKHGQTTYFFNEDGKGHTGIINMNEALEFYQKGILQINRWIQYQGNTYYAMEDGALATLRQNIFGAYYQFGKDGILEQGSWVKRNNKQYYYDNNNNKVTGWYYIDGLKYYFNQKGEMIGTGPVKKVIDISEHNKTVDWDTVKKQGDVDMVILRLGYGSELSQEDKQFARNVKELKRLNIPFAVYLYSYSESKIDAIAEAQNVHNILSKYGISKNTEIYYDLEHFTIGGQYIDVSKKQYEQIVTGFMQKIHSLGYKNAYVYSYKSYLETVLNSPIILPYVKWVAQYNEECTYTGTSYWGWQYTSNGSIPGISGRVDLNVWLK